MESRRTRTRKQVNKCSASGLQSQARSTKEESEMSLNGVTLIGHLGQDPELRHLPTSGQPVASFSVATDEAHTDKQGQRQERVDWHNIVVFGKAAESCKEYLKQGRQVYVEGRLRT